MKEIYIVLTHTGTVLSRIIKNYTQDEFSHVSISLDKELKDKYSNYCKIICSIKGE